VELLQGIHVHGGFTALRDAWQAQLGAKNAAAVNRRVGRLMRCDRCEPAQCPKCFVGALAQHASEDLLARLDTIADQLSMPEADRPGWVVLALRELLVERIELFRQDAPRNALVEAATAGTRAALVPLIETLRAQI
jgi:hypothetical protein